MTRRLRLTATAAALDVLARTGTRVHSTQAVELLQAAGCLVRDGNWVRFPAWLVKDALNSTPGRIVVAGRDRARRLCLEKDKFYFGTGSDCPSLVDPYTDEVRKYTFDDVVNAARISDALPRKERRQRRWARDADETCASPGCRDRL